MSECPDISALESGQRDAAVASHLRDCDACRRLVELIDDRAEDCAQIELLLASDRLSAADAARLERHLAACDVCRELSLLGDDSAGEPAQRYDIGAEVGRGGMGRVFDARDRQLERKVAVKVLRAGVGSEAAARFRREALVTARLQHPSVVAVYEMGQLPTGEPFYAMRKIRGATLDGALRDAEAAAERLALLPNVLAAVEAVAYAHSEGVIHRDLKPSNVMIGPFGETLVVDWGVAKIVGEPESESELVEGPYRMPDRSDELTAAGAVVGTPQFMSPEQASAEPVDERTDVYALGAMLYCLLSGRPPYDGTTSREVVEQVRRGEPPSIDEVAPDAPADLRALVGKAMARAPEDRYPTAGELADDLRRFQTGQLVSAHAYSAGQLFRRWLARNRRVVVASLILLAALLATATVSVRRIVVEKNRAELQRAEAEAQRDRAGRTNLVLLQEQGREALLSKRGGMRAAVYLSEAYSQGGDSAALRYLLAQAMRDVDAAISTVEEPGPNFATVFSSDGTRVLCESSRGGVVRDVASGAREFALPTSIGGGRWSNDDAYLAAREQGGVALWDGRDGTRLRGWKVEGDPELFFDPTRKRLLCIMRDRPDIYLWDTETGEQLVRIDAGSPGTHQAVFSPDGSWLVTSGTDGVVRTWDADELRLAHSVGSTDEQYWGSSFDPGGATFVTSGPNNFATVFDAKTGRPVLRLQGHTQRVLAPTFTPDGRRIVTGSADSTVGVWDARTGDRIHTLRGKGGPLLVSLSADGSRIHGWNLALSQSMVWETLGGLRLQSTGGRPTRAGNRDVSVIWKKMFTDVVYAVTDPLVAEHPDVAPDVVPRLSPDGTRLVFPGDAITVMDAATGELIERLEAERDGAWQAAVDDDGKQVLRREGCCTIAIRPVGAATASVSFEASSRGVARASFSGAGDRVVVVDTAGRVSLWDSTAGTRIAELEGAVDVELSAEISVGDQRIAGVTADGAAILWDAAGKRVAEWRPPRGRAASVELDPSGRRLVVYLVLQKPPPDVPLWMFAAVLLDAATGEQIATLGDPFLGVPHIVWGVIDPAGDYIFLGDTLWNMDTGTPRWRERLSGGIRIAAFSSDSRLLATGGGFGGPPGLYVYDVKTGETVTATLEGRVFAAGFDPAGDRVVTSDLDGTVAVWETSSGRKLAEIPTPPAVWSGTIGPGEWESSAELSLGVFNGDGSRLFVTSPDHIVRVWDTHLETRTPEQIAEAVRAASGWRLEEGELVWTLFPDPAALPEPPGVDR